MMRIEPTCKYMLPCGLCELKKEPCSMTFNHGLTVTTVPLNDSVVVTTTEFNSSAQINKDTTV